MYYLRSRIGSDRFCQHVTHTGSKPVPRPHCTIVFAIASLVIYCGSISPRLEHQSPAPAGQLYRTLTCHFTHWSGNHLAWSLGAFVVLGTICERRSRVGFLICILCAAIMIPKVLRTFQPGLSTYRGLSGIDSALFLRAALPIAADGHWKGRAKLLGPTTVIALFAAKLVYEQLSAAPVFAHSSGAFVPVPLAHLTGAIIGVLCYCGFDLAPALLPMGRRQCHLPNARPAAGQRGI
jgi:rhomboid family GlyGly-CTERM serine protease